MGNVGDEDLSETEWVNRKLPFWRVSRGNPAGDHHRERMAQLASFRKRDSEGKDMNASPLRRTKSKLGVEGVVSQMDTEDTSAQGGSASGSTGLVADAATAPSSGESGVLPQQACFAPAAASTSTSPGVSGGGRAANTSVAGALVAAAKDGAVASVVSGIPGAQAAARGAADESSFPLSPGLSRL